MPFSIVIKPIGPKCNLNCHYCYYLKKEQLYSETKQFRMTDETLETLIRDYVAAHSEAREITFLWQGGEPTLLGRSFFQKALDLQRRYCPPNLKITNSLQTNGTLLNEHWVTFLGENNFLVGLSIDGPQRLHDQYRETRKGAPTFKAVLRALRLLRNANVEFNTLSVVNHANARHGREVYRFLRDEGVQYMQFIPLVERVYDDNNTKISRLSVPPQGYGRFMSAVFKEWQRRDVGSVFVQLFDVQLGLWLGKPSGLCVFAETCGQDPVLEHNGDLYACDHYVSPTHIVGNINNDSIENLARAPEQHRFGADKRDLLPDQCRSCEYLFACNGGCPKHRFMPTADGKAALNYLCPSYKYFFKNAGPTLRKMADSLRHGRPPASATSSY
jgi:uncharacterized protein